MNTRRSFPAGFRPERTSTTENHLSNHSGGSARPRPEAARSELSVDAAETLLQVAHLAAHRPASPSDLRRALEAPAPAGLPLVDLDPDDELMKIVRRAQEIARAAGVPLTRRSLYAALVETEARAAGIELKRLEAARVWVHRKYAPRDLPLRLRLYGSSGSEPQSDSVGAPAASEPLGDMSAGVPQSPHRPSSNSGGGR